MKIFSSIIIIIVVVNSMAMAMHHLVLFSSSHPKIKVPPLQNNNNSKTHYLNSNPEPFRNRGDGSRREAIAIVSLLTLTFTPINSSISYSSTLQENSPSTGSNNVYSSTKKQKALDICSTKSWFQFFGDGFTIRVPPDFQDIMEPEDYNAGLSLYGDKVKPKTYAARFASTDGSEVVSVVTRTTNQLKITFLEAKDITDLGSLKTAAKLFVPGGADLYSARVIKIKEDQGFRTYYYYEFGTYGQHVALVASVNSGKAFIAGATAPQSKWDEDGVKLRSAAISLAV